MKYCDRCKWFSRWEESGDICEHPAVGAVTRGMNPTCSWSVSVDSDHGATDYQRSNSGLCGPEGKLYEPKWWYIALFTGRLS